MARYRKNHRSRETIRLEIVRCRGSPLRYRAVCSELGLKTNPVSFEDVNGCPQSHVQRELIDQIKWLKGSHCHIITTRTSVYLHNRYHDEWVETYGQNLYHDAMDIFDGIDILGLSSANCLDKLSPDDADFIYEACESGRLFWLTEDGEELILVRMSYC